ncbi:MAG: hypothetical protein KGL92_11845 [Gammaproteobacteria bacterium]|nr:hypothetical protein [Gammaproteobacteria bacterium]
MRFKPHWLAGWVLASLSAGAAVPPPPSPVTPPASPRPAEAQPPEPLPDSAFIEFLGDNDVPDQKWWEFMKRAGSQTEAPTSPRQDSKQ